MSCALQPFSSLDRPQISLHLYTKPAACLFVTVVARTISWGAVFTNCACLQWSSTTIVLFHLQLENKDRTRIKCEEMYKKETHPRSNDETSAGYITSKTSKFISKGYCNVRRSIAFVGLLSKLFDYWYV